jgi:HK97 family phage major capsid protein
MSKTKEELEAEEKALGEQAVKMAQAIRAELGLDDIKSELTEVKELVSKSQEANVLKVFVAEDTQKAVNELTAEEKVKAFCIALVNRDAVAVKALSEGVNADGLYTVPTEFEGKLREEIYQQATIRPMVSVITMNRKTKTLDEIINGPDTYWTAEGATKTTTTAEFAQKTLTAFKLAAIIYLTDELIEDSVYDLVSVLIKRFAQRILEKEEAAFLGGNGTTQPEGLFTNSSIGTTSIAGSNLTIDHLINLEYSLPKKFRKGAKYLGNGVNVRELKKLKDSNGRYIWQDGNVQAGTPPTLNSYEFVEHDDCPEGQIMFGNFKEGYAIGDRKGITVKVTDDTETTFTQDKTAIRVVKRVGGIVVFPQYFKKLTNIP